MFSKRGAGYNISLEAIQDEFFLVVNFALYLHFLC